MFVIGRPTPEQIAAYLKQQNSLDFSYDAVGATASTPPAGYTPRHTRDLIGNGKAAFEAAVRAIRQWQQFQLGWVEPHPVETPIRVGESIAVLAHAAGIWCLNACRIVYVVDEQSAGKFGFAYGTLPDHGAAGEERFLVEIDEAERVWYGITAFSRPRHPLTKIGLPIFRQIQLRFVRHSVKVMRQFVSSASAK